MKIEDLRKFCRNYGACPSARLFLEERESIEEVWYDCHNPDWFFWMLETLEMWDTIHQVTHLCLKDLGEGYWYQALKLAKEGNYPYNEHITYYYTKGMLKKGYTLAEIDQILIDKIKTVTSIKEIEAAILEGEQS